MLAVTSRCVIYVHYDADGRVDRYVYRALESLRPYARRIVVVSNSPVADGDRERLAAVTDDLLERPNTGLDVGAHREALAYLGSSVGEYDEVILANSTWFGPIGGWESVFGRTDTWAEVDFWGLTEHKEVSPHPFAPERTLPRHLTSHWLAVRRRLLLSEAFLRFWEEMPPVRTYRDSVRWYESAFTTYFEQQGYVGRALFPADGYRGENPSLQDAMALLRDGCPVLKRRAVFHSRFELGDRPFDPAELRRLLQERGYDVDLILSSVARSASPRRLIAAMGLTELVGAGAYLSTDRAAGTTGAGGPLLVVACECEDADVVRMRLSGAGGERVELIRYTCDRAATSTRPADRGVAGPLGQRASCGLGRAVQAAGTRLADAPGSCLVLVLACPRTCPRAAGAQPHPGVREHPASADRQAVRWTAARRLLAARGRFDESWSLGGLVLADVAAVAACRRGQAVSGAGHQHLDAGVWREADAPLGAPHGIALFRAEALTAVLGGGPDAAGENSWAQRDDRLLEAIHRGGWHVRQVLDLQDAAVLFSEYEYELMSLYHAYHGPQGRLLAYLRASALPGGERAAHVRTLIDIWFPTVGSRLKPAFRRLRGVVESTRSHRRGASHRERERVREPGVRRRRW